MPKKRKALTWFLFIGMLIIAGILFFLIRPAVSYAGFLPLPSAESLGDVPDPEGQGLQKAYNLVWEIARNFRYIIGAVAILFMVISGLRLVIQGENEEVVNKQNSNLYWGLIGLVLIAVAGPLAEILDLQDGGFLANEYEIGYRAKLFDNQVTIIITFIKYIIGSIAVLFMIRSGAKLISSGESDETLNAEKRNLMNSVLALFLVMISDVIIKQVLFKVDYNQADYSATGQQAVVQLDVSRGLQEIVGITNFIVTWASPLAVLALIIGGVMYMTAFGDEEKTGKAKKIIFNSVLALLIIYGAFALVSTFISGVF
ncbi:MAG: hypothetical protein UT36_C0005G0077 [Candidatus Peregrinibacteria bacterium GW2011_GWF2_39_17]|nr:MAG: hypothetical protein UT36_C0005G0077 [Candidatus Peregrinibacteria bacterium GW2011_GWF2_39_17]HCW32912.1 hypothetical protein [Candidatus Peregrinibacteria bacterium]